MHRIGQITSVQGTHAIVELKRHSACGECGGCHHGEDDQPLTTEVINDLKAPVGSFVEIDMPDKDVLRAAFIVYMLPLMVMLLCIGVVFLGVHFFAPAVNPEPVAIIFGVVGLVITYFSIKKWEDKATAREKYIAHVVKVIE